MFSKLCKTITLSGNILIKWNLIEGLLWKAPELLSLTVNKKSKQGDVYAFGIILSEIITRTLPYENYGYPAKGKPSLLAFCI